MAFYNVKLVDGYSKDAFLSEISIACSDKLKHFEGLLFFDITEEQALTLENLSQVEWVEQEPDPDSFEEPNLSPEFSTRTKDLITRTLPPSQEQPGAEYAGAHLYLSGHLPFSGSPKPPGYFTPSEDNRVDNIAITQNYTGKYVDLVVIESVSQSTAIYTLEELESYDSFKDENNNTRLVLMEWGTAEDGSTITSLNSKANNQVTNRVNLVFEPFPTGGTSLVENNAQIRIPNHGFSTFDVVIYNSTTGQDIPGLFSGNRYYVRRITADTIELTSNTTDLTGGFANPIGTPGTPLSGNHRFERGLYGDHIVSATNLIAGKDTSWAKDSSIRLATIRDGISVIYNRVLDWHLNKPLNSEGFRSATVTTGGWQYIDPTLYRVVPVEDVTAIYANNIGAAAINRPAGGWGNDLSAFEQALMVPFYTNYNEWVVPIPSMSSLSSFDNAMSAYNAQNGIYCFQSAGNSGRVLLNKSDPRFNAYVAVNTSGYVQRIALGSSKIDSWHSRSTYTIFADDPTGTNLRRTQGNASHFSTITVSYDPDQGEIPVHEMNDTEFNTFLATQTPPSWQPINLYTPEAIMFPNRNYEVGADHAIIVGACQQSNTYSKSDGYSNRGPALDIWSFGAGSWTSGPSGQQYGGTGDKYKYFSGTSAAAPNAAGIGIIHLESFYAERSVFPSIPKLKELLQETGDIVEDKVTVPWSDVSTINAASITLPTTESLSSGKLYHLRPGLSLNGSRRMSGLHGSPNKRAALPFKIRLGTGKRVVSSSTLNHGVRTSSGQTYPRRKIRIDS